MKSKKMSLVSQPLTDLEIADFNAIIERTRIHGFPHTAQAMREIVAKRMGVVKTCGCCGKAHTSVPSNARYSDDPCFGGYYWECSCRSTLFKPLQPLEKKEAA